MPRPPLRPDDPDYSILSLFPVVAGRDKDLVDNAMETYRNLLEMPQLGLDDVDGGNIDQLRQIALTRNIHTPLTQTMLQDPGFGVGEVEDQLINYQAFDKAYRAKLREELERRNYTCITKEGGKSRLGKSKFKY